MKKLVCILLAAALSLSLVACEGGTTASTEPASTVARTADSSKKELVTADGAMDGGLDPAGFAMQTWVGFSRLCSLPLMSFDDKGEEVMEAAESYSVSDDQLVWTFQLRKDGKWSDGTDVVAADFINTVRRALDPHNSDSAYAEQLYVIKGAEEAHAGSVPLDAVQVLSPDDHKVEFHLKSPCPYFKKLLALPVFYPSKQGVATNENKNWYKSAKTNLCNGPFMLTSFVQDQSYVVEKNPHYFDADKVKIKKITTKCITDVQAQIAAYESGEVHIISGLPDYIETKYKGSKELTIWNMLHTSSILPNETVKPLDNAKVRQAIALALNRQTLCASLGANFEASYTWVPKYMLSNTGSKRFAEEEKTTFQEDASKAKSLLAEAGYPNGQSFPTLTYTYPSSDKEAIQAQAIQAQLKAVLGISIELQAQETEVYNATRRDGNFQLIRSNWTADFNDPINYLSLYTSDASLNYGHIKDADFDRAIANSNAASDPVQRNQFLHEAEDILVKQKFYVIPLSTMHYVGLRNANITGVTYNDKGEAYYRFADIT